jgi:hypothetical protein
MHLKSGVNLEKKEVLMSKNGRPVKAIYYYEDKKIAEINFYFETDSQNFITKKTEKLGYYSVDGIVHDFYTIYEMNFSSDNSYQRQKRLEERTQARQWIIDTLRADIDRILTAATSNKDQEALVSSMINTFWVEYSPHLSAFINAGGTFLRNKFINDTAFVFLNSFVAPGVTVRAYIIDKLTY